VRLIRENYRVGGNCGMTRKSFKLKHYWNEKFREREKLLFGRNKNIRDKNTGNSEQGTRDKSTRNKNQDEQPGRQDDLCMTD
jgi:hypothetical protein